MKIHLTGIGGVGMAALGFLLKTRGHMVTGCDLHPSARTAWLEKNGIPVSFGHDPLHIAEVDLAVMTPAVPATNPERQAATSRGILKWRGEILSELVNAADAVAICGSHGKTTTATFTAKLLLALGEHVEWAIGGETGSFPVAGCEGPANKPCVLVVEADESDGTLALYHARTLVITNCEYDHPDHFKSFDDYLACYQTARNQSTHVIESTALTPLDFIQALPLASHNKMNARAAVEVALQRGHSLASIAAVLPRITTELPDRRFQLIRPGVYTDYAHHPTEIACAISMARQKCRGRLRVLFQPHRYSRTKALLRDFPGPLKNADEVILCPTYAAFEQPIEGGDIADLYAVCRAQDVNVFLARSCMEAWIHARRSIKEGDFTLLLGAGDIIQLIPIVLSDKLPSPHHYWIGQGTNTWQTDLNTGDTYSPTTGRAGAPGATLGIPWMAGIPGTIGGWIHMNAGAFGHSISELLSRVKIDGQWHDAADCDFAYRSSNIVGEIQDYELKANWKDLIANLNATDFLARRKHFPPHTKGSVFKNPPHDFAGRLLEEAGVKSLRVGGAYVWEEHANVIVCDSTARASDFFALARLMHNRVWFKFGIHLEPEVVGLDVGEGK